MSGNTFGTIFKLTTFGESHGSALGAVIDGCPPNIELDESVIQQDLDRRKPGQSKFVTQRKEADKVEILSGVFEGVTTGTPIGLIIRNEDQKSKDYANLKDKFRSGHADITYQEKYGIRDYRGGGRASARETAMRVAGGAIAKKVLSSLGVKVRGGVVQVGDIKAKDINYETKNEFNFLDESKVEELKEFFAKLNIEPGKKIILMPGRLTEWKGQELLIESLNILKTNFGYKNFVAIILGSDQGRDTYKKKLERLVEQHRLNNEVIFLEHANSMPVAYSIAHVVVSASIEPEAFGRVSVEAQSMEKPIIASNIGGSKETIKNSVSGILYKFDDPRELAKALNSMIQNGKEAMQQMGLQGRDNVLAKFNVDKMCEKTFSEYKKLLNIKE